MSKEELARVVMVLALLAFVAFAVAGMW